MFANNGGQYINRHGDPDLCFDGVFGRAIEALDSQVLLDPLGEKFDLPAALAQLADGERRQRGLVGKEHQRLAGFQVVEPDAAQMGGVVPGWTGHRSVRWSGQR